jgi:hypothetical protein
MTIIRPLKILHMDLFGPVAYISIGGNKYRLVIVDDYSRFTWVFFLQDKSETQEVLKKFLRRAQNEFDVKVKKIRSDNNIKLKKYSSRRFSRWRRHQAWIFGSLYSLTKWGGRKEESYSHQDDKNHAWWIQDVGSVLDGGDQYGMSYN